MTNLLRVTLAAAAAAATLASTPAFAAPTQANPPATARARIIKPLTLVRVRDLDFGTIVVQGAGTASMDTAGALTCTATNLTCAATGTPAEYTVTGTNDQVVYITKPNAVLSNTDGSGATLTLVLAGPDQVTLPNSGANGINFTLGGSIAIPATQREGLYQGTLNVSVDYQ